MRKKLVIAAATIVVGAGAAGAVAAFSSPKDGMDVKSCDELLANPPEGGWTCYVPPGNAEHSYTGL